MIKELERTMPGFSNPLVRVALDKQVKQLKQIEGKLGTKAIQSAFDSQKMAQDQHDYIYLRMNWL